MPSSFSRTMAIGGEIGGDEQQQQREHPGNHEEAALELRVEPHADARIDTAAGAGVPTRRSAAMSSRAYSPTSAVA